MTMCDKSWGSCSVELAIVRKLLQIAPRPGQEQMLVDLTDTPNTRAKVLACGPDSCSLLSGQESNDCELEFEGGGMVTGTISVTGGWRQVWGTETYFRGTFNRIW